MIIMRKLKFRVWDGKNMRLSELSDNEGFFIEADGSLGYTEEVGYERHTITNYRKGWIIMQSSGILDCKGIEIYEGDILKCTRANYPDFNCNYLVDYCEEYAAYTISSISTDRESLTVHLGTNPFRFIHEIIGNKYNNPELIQP